MLDVFFISMGEEGSEANWQRLLSFAPHAKRVDNVKGIYEVHKACAQLSTTTNFYVVDADAWVLDSFKFHWEPDADTLHWDIPETECVIVWPSCNPVNGLEYGYGGIKLFPRQPFLEDREWELDLSTTIASAVVTMSNVGCETRFNTTPESAWIGAFRECAKLASLSMIKSKLNKLKNQEKLDLEKIAEYVSCQDWNNDKKATYRKTQSIIVKARYLHDTDIFSHWAEIEKCSDRRLTWCTIGWNEHNGKYSILGARAGAKYGLKFSDEAKSMNMINDWDWLKKEFANVTV